MLATASPFSYVDQSHPERDIDIGREVREGEREGGREGGREGEKEGRYEGGRNSTVSTNTMYE